jgi:hypothetical protein
MIRSEIQVSRRFPEDTKKVQEITEQLSSVELETSRIVEFELLEKTRVISCQNFWILEEKVKN